MFCRSILLFKQKGLVKVFRCRFGDISWKKIKEKIFEREKYYKDLMDCSIVDLFIAVEI